MISWFNKKKAPDGTSIIRHENVDTELGQIPGAAEFTQLRETAYERLFGRTLSVSHEVFPLMPHIDVYTYKRTQGDKEVYSLVTGGMSDLKMELPRQADEDVPRRVELIFYCSEPREDYIATLRQLAHFPHSSNSWLGHGHTMPNGNPPEPLWEEVNWTPSSFCPQSSKRTRPSRQN